MRRSVVLVVAVLVVAVVAAAVSAFLASPASSSVARVGRDGSIAFSCGGRLCVIGADGSGLKRLNPVSWTAFSVDGPAWSPNGKHLAFNGHYESGTLRLQNLFIRDESGHTRELSDTGRGEVGVSWSPNGKQLAVGSGGDSPALSLVSVATGRQEVISNACGYACGQDSSSNAAEVGGFDPAWSPDGAWIAYRFGWGYVDGVLVLRGLALVHPGGSGYRQLARLGGDPSWSPDARRIAFTHLDRPGTMFTEWEDTGERGGEHGISVINRDGSHPVRLTTRQGDRDPAWSPSGKYIAFTRGVGDADLWIMRSDGTRQRLLVANGSKPSWQPLP